ncbi:hypothetical protein SAMN05443543_11610 [Flavobacterium flevense]|uniref:DUF4870 domain-containing protein n=1 Tax=Flavobacterium flevense TaxID=983 RepID=A0A4Y4AYF2_9FLAO|nr:DUF4870 domain-containing protein [Flavobacterium flevense]GEC73301.1 hypothetical protein FFL01_28400 [Flavobacterium flevense]SHM17430.1 hypothetical protein SAMN05443543_11610 [Flavobacterium flevense]
METNSNKTTAAITHLSALTQYFIPFGNFIFPIIIWSSKKEQSEFIDYHGKQVLNFQLSIFIYSLILGIIAIPVLLFTIFNGVSLEALINDNDFIWSQLDLGNLIGEITFGILLLIAFFLLKVFEFFLIIIAAINASNGERYKYPITINFIK